MPATLNRAGQPQTATAFMLPVSGTLRQVLGASASRMTSLLPFITKGTALGSRAQMYRHRAALGTGTLTGKILDAPEGERQEAPIMGQAQNKVLCLYERPSILMITLLSTGKLRR